MRETYALIQRKKIYGKIEFLEDQAVYAFNDGNELTEIADIHSYIEIKGNIFDDTELLHKRKL